MHSGHTGGDINQIDLSKESRQIRSLPVINVVLGSNMLMYEPTGDFSIIDSIDQVIGADDVTTSEDVRLALVLHGMSVDVDLTFLVPHQHFYCTLGVF